MGTRTSIISWLLELNDPSLKQLAISMELMKGQFSRAVNGSLYRAELVFAICKTVYHRAAFPFQ